jgi:hypothetical protein
MPNPNVPATRPIGLLARCLGKRAARQSAGIHDAARTAELEVI